MIRLRQNTIFKNRRGPERGRLEWRTSSSRRSLVWTSQLMREIEEMAKGGMSYGEIAERLGPDVTSNMIGGKLRRMKRKSCSTQ